MVALRIAAARGRPRPLDPPRARARGTGRAPERVPDAERCAAAPAPIAALPRHAPLLPRDEVLRRARLYAALLGDRARRFRGRARSVRPGRTRAGPRREPD